MKEITKETQKESLLKLDKKTRYKLILECLKDYQNGLTAREIAEKLGFTERNSTAPRLTELVEMGKVEVVGKKLDKLTNTSVSVYRLKQDNVKHIVVNGKDFGYKQKCENCSYADIEYKDYSKTKFKSAWCNKLKTSITEAQYKKISVCLFFEKEI